MEQHELTVAQAAAALGVSERTVWRYLRAGRLEGRTEGEPGFQRTLIAASSLAGATQASRDGVDPVVRAEVQRLSALLDAANDEIARLNDEKLALGELVAELRNAPPKPDPATLEAIATLRAEKEALSALVGQLHDAPPDPALVGELGALRAERDALAAQVRALEDAPPPPPDPAVAGEIAALRAEKEALTALVGHMQDTAAPPLEALEAQRELVRLRDENTALSALVEHLQATPGTAPPPAADPGEGVELARLTAERDALAAERDTLRHQRDTLSAEVTALTSAPVTPASAAERIAKLTAERDELQQRVARLQRALAGPRGSSVLGRVAEQILQAKDRKDR